MDLPKDHIPLSQQKIVRISMDELLKIADAYYNAAKEVLLESPDDKSAYALATFSHNASDYIKILRQYIDSFEKIKTILRLHRAKTGQNYPLQ